MEDYGEGSSTLTGGRSVQRLGRCNGACIQPDLEGTFPSNIKFRPFGRFLTFLSDSHTRAERRVTTSIRRMLMITSCVECAGD